MQLFPPNPIRVQIVLLLFLNFISQSLSAKILFLLPVATKSHKNVFEPLFKAMADRGNEVTVVSPGFLPKPHKNIRELVPITYEELVATQGQAGYKSPLERRSQGNVGGSVTILTLNFDFAIRACAKVYESQEVLDLLNEPFDLIFINGFLNNCLQGLIHKLGAPFIIISTMAAPNIITYSVGNYLPPSFVPFPISDFSDDMTFTQRLKNNIFDIYFNVKISRLYKKFEAVYRHHLGEDVPDLVTLEKNVSMIFSNSNFALTFPRPYLPDIVEVGGMHCRPPKPLPKDLDEFLSGAEHGFIYFSLGSVVNTNDLPDDIRLKFLNVFSRMKQRVIWKWNSGQMNGLPENVRVSKWLPQQDILGHPNIRVFMTHGGLLSTQEAAYHGVPLIGIPVFADQDLNMRQAVKKGYALTMEILDFTEEKLESLLSEILNENRYSAEAKKLSAIIKDQLRPPLELAVFWSEYVIRHNGARHLRSAAARNLNLMQYLSIDVITFIGIVLVSISSFLIFSCTLCLRKIFGRKQAESIIVKKKEKCG